MSVGYLLLLPLSEFELIFDEAIYTALFVLLVTSSGFLSALTGGKNGMKGNLAVSVVGVFWFASTYSSTDALWAVGLLFLGFYHTPILLGWSAGYGFYKNRKRKKMETEPVEIANT